MAPTENSIAVESFAKKQSMEQHTPDLLDDGSIPNESHNESALNPGKSPQGIVDGIASQANEWREPSHKSEEVYVQAIRQWLDSLPHRQRAVTRRILREAHPVMRSLRMAIREKKSQLASLSFNSTTSPDTLPRLGKDLQELRKSLKIELQKLSKRLKDEAGVSMGPLGGDGFWLAPPVENSGEQSADELRSGFLIPLLAKF